MNAINGIVQDGQIRLAEPVAWPDGTPVCIKPIRTVAELHDAEANGQSDAEIAETSEDPEAIASWLADFEAIPPVHMTQDEELAWQAARTAQRQLEASLLENRLEKLRGAWE